MGPKRKLIVGEVSRGTGRVANDSSHGDTGALCSVVELHKELLAVERHHLADLCGLQR